MTSTDGTNWLTASKFVFEGRQSIPSSRTAAPQRDPNMSERSHRPTARAFVKLLHRQARAAGRRKSQAKGRAVRERWTRAQTCSYVWTSQVHEQGHLIEKRRSKSGWFGPKAPIVSRTPTGTSPQLWLGTCGIFLQATRHQSGVSLHCRGELCYQACSRVLKSNERFLAWFWLQSRAKPKKLEMLPEVRFLTSNLLNIWICPAVRSQHTASHPACVYTRRSVAQGCKPA